MGKRLTMQIEGLTQNVKHLKQKVVLNRDEEQTLRTNKKNIQKMLLEMFFIDDAALFIDKYNIS